MPKLFLPFIILLLSNIFAENCGDTISLKGNYFFGYKFSYNCSDFEKVSGLININPSFVDIIAQSDPAAKTLGSAKTYSYLGLFLGVLGGAIIGWDLAEIQAGKEINKPLFYSAFPMIAVGTSFNLVGTRKMKNAVHIFNNRPGKLSKLFL